MIVFTCDDTRFSSVFTVYFSEREREGEQGRDSEGETENPEQALC